ncbi:HNH endonuclease [Streptomyces sp. NPDC054863]
MTRCSDCTELATHRGRCHTHHQAYEQRSAVRSRHRQRKRSAQRHAGAAALRKRLQAKGHAWCDWCLEDFPADAVDVDHVRPLSLGGEDVASNVQVLCRPCHVLKTATDFGGSVAVHQ